MVLRTRSKGLGSEQLLLACALSLLLLLLLPAALAQAIVGADPAHPLRSVQTEAVNSTALLLTLELSPLLPLEGHQLRLVTQPQSGNATESLLDLQASPMSVELRGLRPDTLYTFRLSVEGPQSNSSAPFAPFPSARTHRLGPQIVGFFASDPEQNGDVAADAKFSAGDVVTILFDGDTNQPGPLGSAAEVQRLFKFSQPLGAEYSGRWSDARTLQLTVRDVGQSDPQLGYLTVQVVGDVRSPDGLSDVSRSASPPLIGSWEFQGGSFRYFRPTKDGAPIEQPDYRAFHIATQVDTPVALGMSLQLPEDAPRAGFMVSATLLYPRDVAQIGFQLSGRNFSQPPATIVGSDTALSSAQLQAVVPSVSLAPKPGYTGYACVTLQLYDLSNGYQLLATEYVNIRVDPPARLYVPEIIVGDAKKGNFLERSIDGIKANQTPVIIGVCVTLGALLLGLLGFCAYRRIKGRSDARDFERSALSQGDEAVSAPAASSSDGATRRFYYDAKV